MSLSLSQPKTRQFKGGRDPCWMPLSSASLWIHALPDLGPCMAGNILALVYQYNVVKF